MVDTKVMMQRFITLQDTLNKKLHPQWSEQGWAYPDAIFTEATEAYNHLNWEWWKSLNRSIDWQQVKLEWVDVAHFLFSQVIVEEEHEDLFAEVDFAFNEYATVPSATIDLPTLKGNIKAFIRHVLDYDEGGKILAISVLPYFFQVVKDLGISLEDFYVLFVGKVALNELRWKNGYKKGIYLGGRDYNPSHYIKDWQGVEDNEWLSEFAKTLDTTSDTFKDDLSKGLEAKYEEMQNFMTAQAAIWQSEDKANMEKANTPIFSIEGEANDLLRTDIVGAVLRQV